ncbi:hypothetical protein J5N97_012244 [Dioscorea zingiberensis]|uniref:Uncharacterized protein n=1 Tax=Dioscorea zingiberensis TaxID=325984 RepID=A0A9D5HHJ3_9LILI|nr:hypothetical protein J5N97_012244 [Dioscorea zingiberensis]
MAYRRQPYGGWGNYGGNDDDYAAPNGRAPRFDACQPPNRPWERNKAAISQDDINGGVVGNDYINYGENKNEEPTVTLKAQQNTPAAAAQTTDHKYTDSYRTAYSKPAGNSSGRNDDYADSYGRGAATRFEARQPPNRPWERNKAASHEVDNKDDDDDDDDGEKKLGEPAALPQKPQPYASAAAAHQPTKNHIGGNYGTASANRHAYNYNRSEDDMNVGSHPNRWANRRGGAGVEQPVGYGKNIKYYNNNEKNNAGEDGTEEEELIRRDFANRFTLSPRREHVIPKKQGETSTGSGGQPNVVVVKAFVVVLTNLFNSAQSCGIYHVIYFQ